MKHSAERECNVCGRRCFAGLGTLCNINNCGGTFCSVITPLPGKRVSGVLVRDGGPVTNIDDIAFFPDVLLSDVETNMQGDWVVNHGFEGSDRSWTVKQWKKQYGKLPRKGTKQLVIIELVPNGK